MSLDYTISQRRMFIKLFAQTTSVLVYSIQMSKYFCYAVLSLLLFIILGVRKMFLIITVRGESMMPTLHWGEKVIFKRLYFNCQIKRNQIVLIDRAMVKNQNQSIGEHLEIKRVVGLPGEIIVTKLDELPLEFRAHEQTKYSELGERVWHIPTGHYFVRADNVGIDSLIWGPIPYVSLIGIMISGLSQKDAVSD